MVSFFEDHPAFLRLLDAPESAGRSSARARFREQLTELFGARKPRMPSQKARRLAIVTQQIMRALRVAYAEAKPRERPHLVREFKEAIFYYLCSRLEMPSSTAKRSWRMQTALTLNSAVLLILVACYLEAHIRPQVSDCLIKQMYREGSQHTEPSQSRRTRVCRRHFEGPRWLDHHPQAVDAGARAAT